jgi:hypothetical protein
MGAPFQTRRIVMKQVDYCGEYDEVDLLACDKILGKLEEAPPEEGDDFWECEE